MSLTTHFLLGVSSPLFKALENRIFLLEVVRHPLYMLIQQTLNMERLLNDSLQFDFSNLNWVISDLSPAYGAGLLSAQFNSIPLSVKDIIDNRN